MKNRVFIQSLGNVLSLVAEKGDKHMVRAVMAAISVMKNADAVEQRLEDAMMKIAENLVTTKCCHCGEERHLIGITSSDIETGYYDHHIYRQCNNRCKDPDTKESTR